MVFNVIDDIFLNCPTKEVEFTDSSDKCLKSRHFEQYTLTSTEGIKELFTICFELRLVICVYKELGAFVNVGHAMAFAEIGYKPINET